MFSCYQMRKCTKEREEEREERQWKLGQISHEMGRATINCFFIWQVWKRTRRRRNRNINVSRRHKNAPSSDGGKLMTFQFNLRWCMTVSLVREPRRNHKGRFQPDKGRPPIIAVDEEYNLDKLCRITSISLSRYFLSSLPGASSAFLSCW